MVESKQQHKNLREFHKALVEQQACPCCLHQLGNGQNPCMCPQCDCDVTEYVHEIIEDRRVKQGQENRYKMGS